GRGRGLNLDSLQSLVGGIGHRLQVALFVIAGRFADELFIRGCIRVVLGIGSRNRADENAGWRYRAFEDVRCAGIRSTALVPLYAVSAVVLCGAFLYLYGVCALAVSARAKHAIQTKKFRFIKSRC